MTTVRRDPFARQTVYSYRVWDPAITGCQECGRLLYTKAGRAHLLRYELRPDDDLSGARRNKIHGAFCTWTCAKAYTS